MRRFLTVGSLAVAFALSMGCVAQTPSLTLIAPPAGRTQTFVSALSMDGRVVTGYTRDANFVERGFTWTREGGMDEWGARADIPLSTNPFAMSSDGSVIVGQRFDSATNTNTPFRYTNGVYQNLGPAPAGSFAGPAYGVSGDGTTIVGALSRNGLGRAMRWTAAAGVQDAGVPSGTFAGWFTGISRDGGTTLGVSTGLQGGFDAFTWTQAGGWNHLPVPSGVPNGYDAGPQAANFDGSLIVGYVDPFGSDRSSALLWRNGVPSDLGTFGLRWDMYAGGISDDGRVIAGSGTDRDTGRSTPAIWLDGSGPINFEDYMRSLGYSLPSGWVMRGIGDMSADGRTILGLAQNGPFYQGFIATIPTTGVPVFFGIVGLAVCGSRRRS